MEFCNSLRLDFFAKQKIHYTPLGTGPKKQQDIRIEKRIITGY
jgi:hypothetical protein